MEPNFDKAHREAFAEAEDKLAQAQVEKDTLLEKAHEEAIAEDKNFEYAKEERERMEDKEMHGELSLEETVALLKERGYLDTSFEGKETHRLTIEALSKEEAIARYKQSGGKTWVWDEIEKNMPYNAPEAKTLDVMIVNFIVPSKRDKMLREMSIFGVRPLTYEELIQYGIANPIHQEINPMVSLGSSYNSLAGNTHLPCLGKIGNERGLGIEGHFGSGGSDKYRFPVVRK